MPESKPRKKTASSAPQASSQTYKPNPVWFKPVMFVFMLVGFLWVIVYYISGTTLPVPTLGSWNIVIGFAVMFVGFIMTTRWK